MVKQMVKQIIAEPILSMHNSTNVSVDAQGETFEVDESSRIASSQLAVVVDPIEAYLEQKATVMSIEGLKIGKRRKVKLRGLLLLMTVQLWLSAPV